MTIHDILSRLEGVRGGNGRWTACCPNHGDAHQSLSISIGNNGRVLMKCHAGCSTEDIVWAMGLQMKDLFTEPQPAPRAGDKPPIVATYTYPSGAQKLRRADKSFLWRRPDGKGGWIWSRKGVPHELYIAGKLGGIVYVYEGEKDVDNFHAQIGGCAVGGADGAGPGKWRKEYTEQLRGCTVVILPDNDDVGRTYAQETADALHSAANSVRLLDLSKVWPEIPEHGDVSDLIDAKGAAEAARLIASLAKDTPEWDPDTAVPDPLLSLFKPLEDFTEEEAKWLVEGWIPEGQISVIAADGGIGKTTLWCHVIAALSNGKTCILDPPETTREPMRITFLTTEDSVRKKLRKKLRLSILDHLVQYDW